MTLEDRFGREIGNVRISLTDRCNLRCQYCMPEEGIDWLSKSEILTFEEIIQLMEIFHSQGVKKFRITGGEPLVREDIVDFVKMASSTFDDIDLAMTTNGLRLKKLGRELYNAGLQRLNISLDTLNHNKFNEITRRDQLQTVLEAIKYTTELGFEVKINAVSIKSFNDDIESLQKFVDFSEKLGIEVRFIEIMPFTGNNWKDGGFISSSELRDRLSQKEELVKLPMKSPASTSKTWGLREGKAKIGFISSVSESFCHSCNRVRITSEGNLRPCLHNAREYDLRTPLREGKSKDEILEIIKEGLKQKWKEHPDFLSISYESPVDDREMIRIGG